ncbi:MAG: hypothetical protein HYY40_03210 [Bacteroidetes bacterium]|nr:hypothetical protein [Bacteroidota bacterium]
MQFITPDMEHVFKLWTILFVVTIYSCNSENSSEISTGIEQREKVSDTGSNNNAIVIPKELDSVRETEMDNSVLSADTVTSEKIMIALTGMYRKGDKEHLISGDGKQWYGVFTNVDGPPKYKIIPTILHIKDTVDEGDITYDEYEKTPNSIIISADNNKDNWNNCLFLFKGIKTAAKQEKNYPQ